MSEQTQAKRVTLNDGIHFTYAPVNGGLFKLVVTQVKGGRPIAKWNGPDDGLINIGRRVVILMSQVYDHGGIFKPEWVPGLREASK